MDRMPATSRRPGTIEILRAGRFALVGVGATVLHLLVAQAVLYAGAAPVIANLSGFVVAFLGGLIGHHYFTFGQSTTFRRAFRRYGVIALAGFLANNGILMLLVSRHLVSDSLALAIAILVIPLGTFLASRFWGFVPSRQQ